MTRLLTTVLYLCSTTMLFSCGKNTNNETQPEATTPKALKEEQNEVMSFSRGNYDLTEELYLELVEKSPELKKLENDLAIFEPKPGKVLSVFEKYATKSNEYYNSAEASVTSIQDSLLRKKILNLLATSKKQLGSKTAELEGLISQISKNSSNIHDYHAVLKIVLTMSVIEKYQNENIPDNKPFQELVKEQGKLKQQIDGLTPKY